MWMIWNAIRAIKTIMLKRAEKAIKLKRAIKCYQVQSGYTSPTPPVGGP